MEKPVNREKPLNMEKRDIEILEMWNNKVDLQKTCRGQEM